MIVLGIVSSPCLAVRPCVHVRVWFPDDISETGSRIVFILQTHIPSFGDAGNANIASLTKQCFLVSNIVQITFSCDLEAGCDITNGLLQVTVHTI